MAVQPINNDPMLYNLTRTATGKTIDSTAGKMWTKNAAEDTVAFAASGEAQTGFARINSTKEAIAGAAKTIRAADDAMAAIGETLVKMKESLEGIVKNYPPYLQGSDERIKMLKSFSALRKQIDALTMPPTPDGTEYAKIVGEPAVAGSGGIKVTTEKGDMVTINAQEVHTGPTGLDIPALPDMPGADATDHQIYQALGKLDTAVKILGERQSGLAADAQKLLA